MAIGRGKPEASQHTPSVLFSWYQQAQVSNILVEENVLHEKAKNIAEQLKIENFTVSNGWIIWFKDWHGIVHKKSATESAAVDSESKEVWLEGLPTLLEGYEPRDIYDAEEMGLFFNVLSNRTLALNGESCHGGESSKDRLTVFLCANRDRSDMQVLIVTGKSMKPQCFTNIKKLAAKCYAYNKAWMMTDIFFIISAITKHNYESIK
jgi:hypothetical protein